MGTLESLEAARDAAMEAHRTRRLLAQLDKDAHDGHLVREGYRASLRRRLDLCEHTMDEARAVLDNMEVTGGACGWVLEAMRLYYLDALTWPEVGELVFYSCAHTRRMVFDALRTSEPNS